MAKIRKPVPDDQCEAHSIATTAFPGAVFLKMRRLVGGKITRQMYLEMEPDQVEDLIESLRWCAREARRSDDNLG